MEISLTKQQFTELLKLVHIGSYMRNGVLEEYGEYIPARDEALEDMLCQAALERAVPGVEEYEFGYTGLTQDLEEECHDIIEEFREEQFWSELELRLGQRDINKNMTMNDWMEPSENDGWLPECLHTICDLYADEFDKHGIDRLGINGKSSTLAHDEGCDCVNHRECCA